MYIMIRKYFFATMSSMTNDYTLRTSLYIMSEELNISYQVLQEFHLEELEDAGGCGLRAQ